ncbi:MAG: pyruvate dehydrogenase complex dihydrolipoamide acetyltransferase [Cytophagaceae bacterium]|nr:pyruvate dehydrogenase complex dihydrolipoamide acetyltransferase [Cytophagaceae bacterium]
MAEVIRMPLLSDTMTEGVIAEWLKKEGDTVKSGDILAEIETDKATMELENYSDGTLLHIAAQKGTTIAVNGILAVVGAPGEDFQALLNGNAPEGGNTIASQKSENDAQAAVPAGEDQQVAAATGSGNLSQRSSDGGASTQPVAAPASTPAPAAPAPSAPTKPAEMPAPTAPAPSAPANVNAVAIKMPKMSDTMTEGTIVAWLKKVGDKVKSGDILAEVETDKATMELDNYDDGTLLYIGPKEGDAVQVDEIIAIVGEEGADFQALLNGGVSAAPANGQAPPTPQTTTPTAEPATNGQATDGDGRIKASPLAKEIAKDKGIDLKQVQGSGENGRIVKRDIDNFTPGVATPGVGAPAPQPEAKPAQAAQPAPAAAAPDKSPAQLPKVYGEESFEDVALSQMRKTIARRLGESKFSAPHFYVTMEINMDKAVVARGSMNEISPVKISYNDLVIKAVAVALQTHPAINASWLGDKIRYNHHIHIGMAVAVDEGLLVPVIRFANLKSLSAISTEAKDLGGRAKNKKLQPAEMQGNTFTISNLGMFGVDEFTAIINPPDACILAIGGIKETVKVENGEIKPASVMKVTLSSDHRVVDGAKAAAFLQTFKMLLEDPIRLLV